MSRDNFLPKSLNKIHEKFQTPHILTWISGLIVIVCALFMDLNISAELCNFGTFTSFIIICIAVLILRKTEATSALYFIVWLLIGLTIYAAYSYKEKRREESGDLV